MTLALFHMPQGTELIIILVIGLLIFGRKLPELGRSLGRGIVEFKKGLKGMKDEMDVVNKEVSEAERLAELEADRAARLEAASREKVTEKTATTVGERHEPPAT